MTPRRRAALLALAAAYVDTCGFIGLFGLFTAHVTGNFVLIGAELVSRHDAILTKLLALPVFLASVLLTAQAEVVLQRRGRAAAAWLLGVEAALVAAAAVVAWRLPAPGHADDASTMAIGFVLIAAMGVQNALMRTSLAGPVQTTVMTGNVTQIAIDLLARATGRADATALARIANAWPAILGFAAGSALGAAGYAWLGFTCLWGAVVLVLAAAFASRLSNR
ncbi:MAG TPA: YoaK family protein [Roseateles sp.]